MNYTEWKLTDQEIAECRVKGVNINGTQLAKKQAYIKAGGIILNPDALSVLYEACKMMLRLIEGENLDEQFDGEAEVLRDAIAQADS